MIPASDSTSPSGKTRPPAVDSITHGISPESRADDRDAAGERLDQDAAELLGPFPRRSRGQHEHVHLGVRLRHPVVAEARDELDLSFGNVTCSSAERSGPSPTTRSRSGPGTQPTRIDEIEDSLLGHETTREADGKYAGLLVSAPTAQSGTPCGTSSTRPRAPQSRCTMSPAAGDRAATKSAWRSTQARIALAGVGAVRSRFSYACTPNGIRPGRAPDPTAWPGSRSTPTRQRRCRAENA